MNRAGELVNNLCGNTAYKSFRPTALPPELNIDSDMVKASLDSQIGKFTKRDMCIIYNLTF